MQLTQFADYSLRALIYITLKKTTCTIKDIADAYAIPTHHMNKIIHNLAKLDIIKTVRGKSGGMTMAINPEDINLRALVLKLEPHFDLVPCFNKEKANCCIAPVCKLKHVFHEAQKTFMNVLDQYTLADVLYDQAALNTILKIRV